MVGAAYSFVKMIIVMLCIQTFLQDYDTVMQRLVG